MDWIRAQYLITAPASDIAARALAVAIEQSVEMPLEPITSRYVRDEIIARVAEIVPADAARHRVTIEISAATTGAEPGQLMSMLFGNCSLLPEVELVDVQLPPALLAAFPGPRFGIDGIRALLGVHDRALTATALKPQGLSTGELVALCRQLAIGGIDIIKDDHGIADQYANARFADRVPALQRTVDDAGRAVGRTISYVPNLSGNHRAMDEQLRIARGEGVRMVMAAPMLMGLANFQELTAQAGVPVLAHPTFSGTGRIAPALLFGRLFRLFGADAVIFTNFGGRFSYSKQTCRALAAANTASWGHVRASMPVPAGGMTVERVPELLETYGTDSMLLIGGSLLAAGAQLQERSRAFVDLVASGGRRQKPQAHSA